MVKAILFDLDGTLLDTKELIFQSTEHALVLYGYPVPDRDYITSLVGEKLETFYQIILKQKNVEKFCLAHVEFQTYNLKLVKPFPNVLLVLKSLRKQEIKQAIITNRKKNTTGLLLKMNNLIQFFDLILSEEDTLNDKPHPEPLLLAIKTLNVKALDTMMVGDGSPDILAGKKAGVKTVGVTYGFKGEALEQLKPDYLIDDILSLVEIINRVE